MNIFIHSHVHSPTHLSIHTYIHSAIFTEFTQSTVIGLGSVDTMQDRLNFVLLEYAIHFTTDKGNKNNQSGRGFCVITRNTEPRDISHSLHSDSYVLKGCCTRNSAISKIALSHGESLGITRGFKK